MRMDLLISKKSVSKRNNCKISCFISTRHFKQARGCSVCLIIWEKETRILPVRRGPISHTKLRKRELNGGSYPDYFFILSFQPLEK